MSTAKYTESLEKSRVEKKATLQELKDYVQQYDELISLLSVTLPQKLKHEVMVPFGPGAFFKGEIRHTNEVIMHLGDSYFAERTTVNAVKTLSERRKDMQVSVTNQEAVIKGIEERLKMIAEKGIGGVVEKQLLSSKSGNRGNKKDLETSSDLVNSETREVDSDSIGLGFREIEEKEGDMEKWMEERKKINRTPETAVPGEFEDDIEDSDEEDEDFLAELRRLELLESGGGREVPKRTEPAKAPSIGQSASSSSTTASSSSLTPRGCYSNTVVEKSFQLPSSQIALEKNIQVPRRNYDSKSLIGSEEGPLKSVKIAHQVPPEPDTHDSKPIKPLIEVVENSTDFESEIIIESAETKTFLSKHTELGPTQSSTQKKVVTFDKSFPPLGMEHLITPPVRPAPTETPSVPTKRAESPVQPTKRVSKFKREKMGQ